MAGVFSFLGGLFGGRPQAIAPPTERVQGILDQIHAEAQPCLHLVPGGEGRTRLGGEADVSGDWPRFRDRPMACLARIDLQEVHAAGGPDWLPPEGRLHVFLDMGDRPQDFEPEQPGACIVRLETGPARPVAPPDDLRPRSRIAAFPLMSTPRMSYADERIAFDWKSLTKAETLTLEAAVLEMLSPEPAHQIGGYPGNLQGDDMEIQCAAAAAGTGDVRTFDPDDITAETISAARHWRLFLQVDSDPAAGLEWMRRGRLYFWVHDAAARQGDFSRVFVFLHAL